MDAKLVNIFLKRIYQMTAIPKQKRRIIGLSLLDKEATLLTIELTWRNIREQ